MRRSVIALLLVCSCATAQTLIDKASAAQQEVEATISVLHELDAACKEEPSPKPKLCDQVERAVQELEALKPYVGG